MMLLRSPLLTVAVLTFLAGRAVAGPADGAPWFALADRQDGGSWIGGAITWAPLEEVAFVGGGSIARLDVAGQYVTTSGLGGYGTTAALSAHLRLPVIEPSLAIGLPLDSDVRDFIAFFVSAGVKVTLP